MREQTERAMTRDVILFMIDARAGVTPLDRTLRAGAAPAGGEAST